MGEGMGSWSTYILLVYVTLLLTGCMFKGPSFNAEQEGKLSCLAPVQESETIVVSDLIPAVAGMLLAPQDDAELQAKLKAQAAGGAVR